MRHTPTTLRNDFGSAPMVSSEKSIFSGWTALALNSNAARPTPATATVIACLIVLMADLHLGQVVGECVERGGSTTTQWLSTVGARRKTRAASDRRRRSMDNPDSPRRRWESE